MTKNGSNSSAATAAKAPRPPVKPQRSDVKRLTPTPPPATPPESAVGKALKARVQKFLTLYDQLEALDADYKARKKELEEKYDAAHADLLGDMNVAGLSEMKGPETGGRRIKKDPKIVATIEDFDQIWAYIKENDAPELLQKRLSSTAVKERQEQGVTIPGVGRFERIELKVTK